MKNIRFSRIAALMIAAASVFFSYSPAEACTGISLTAKDGSFIVARTMEWGSFVMDSRWIVVPRGYVTQAQTPSGPNGMKIVAKYGYAGIGVLEDNLVAEAVNEKGLMGELFYFPKYGGYEKYDPSKNATTLSDAHFLAWVLGNFATIAEMEKEIGNIHVVPYGKGFDTAHFRLADATGRQVVVEYIDGKLNIFEDKIGIITNAPSFDWHMTNLNNYVNVFAGAAPVREVAPGVTLSPTGIGSASYGLPGDVTPPSRFVRAAFYVHTARPQATGLMSVMQCFQILNNFDIPVGVEFPDPKDMPDMLSATQWTTAVDLKHMKFYYRTQFNSAIRCIDVAAIDFGRVKYQSAPLDNSRHQPVEYIKVK